MRDRVSGPLTKSELDLLARLCAKLVERLTYQDTARGFEWEALPQRLELCEKVARDLEPILPTGDSRLELYRQSIENARNFRFPTLPEHVPISPRAAMVLWESALLMGRLPMCEAVSESGVMCLLPVLVHCVGCPAAGCLDHLGEAFLTEGRARFCLPCVDAACRACVRENRCPKCGGTLLPLECGELAARSSRKLAALILPPA